MQCGLKYGWQRLASTVTNDGEHLLEFGLDQLTYKSIMKTFLILELPISAVQGWRFPANKFINQKL